MKKVILMVSGLCDEFKSHPKVALSFLFCSITMVTNDEHITRLEFRFFSLKSAVSRIFPQILLLTECLKCHKHVFCALGTHFEVVCHICEDPKKFFIWNFIVLNKKIVETADKL